MKSDKIKVTLVLPNLLAGGAERVISFIAQNIDPKNFQATLLIVGHSKDASYDVENIKMVFLEKPRVLSAIPALFKYLIRNKPDILVSTVGHLNAITGYMSFFFPRTKFIAREVTVLSLDAVFSGGNKFHPLSYIADKRFLFFDKIICQSHDMLEDIKHNYQINEDRFVVINNPITDSFELKSHKTINDPVRYITVGRLDRVKGIDRILKTLAKLDFPFHYTIIGDGTEKEHLFSLIEQYNLTDKISHIGFTKEVSTYLDKSDLFLQGSHFEGFPNCLIESCSVGTPVIAFKAPGGTKEIIEDGINGFLVETEEEFIEKLTNPRKWDPEKVRASVYKKFSKELIIRQYEDLFRNIVAHKN